MSCSNNTKHMGLALKTYTDYTPPFCKHYTVKNWYIILCYACLLHRIYRLIAANLEYFGYVSKTTTQATRPPHPSIRLSTNVYVNTVYTY